MSAEKRDPKDVVREWFEKSGFPFEVEVAEKLQRAAFREVQVGRAFTDLDTGKTRELDVIASNLNFLGGDYGWRCDVVVECKMADQPWALMAARETHQVPLRTDELWDLATPRSIGGAYLPNVQALASDLTLFNPTMNVARFVVGMKDQKGGQDLARPAIEAVLDGALAYLNDPHTPRSLHPSDLVRPLSGSTPLGAPDLVGVAILVPVVVTTSPLILIRPSSSGHEFHRVDQALVVVQRDGTRYGVHIVTEAGLDGFVFACKATAQHRTPFVLPN